MRAFCRRLIREAGVVAGLLAILTPAACSRCEPKKKPIPPGPQGVQLDIVKVPPVALTNMQSLDAPTGFGLPAGCRVDLPIRSVPVGKRDLRFGATRSHLSELALLEVRDGALTASSIFDFESKKSQPSPWTLPDSPPPWDRATSGWIAGLTKAKEGSVHSAVLWRAGGPHRATVHGDQLTVSDVACDGNVCALLSTLAREARAPGATLSWSDDHPAAHIATAGDEAWEPLSIVRLSAKEHAADVALVAPGSVQLWSVSGAGARPGAKVDAVHGVYDVVQSAKAVVIAPGLSPAVQCQDGGFPLQVSVLGGAKHTVLASGAPHGVFARALSAGSIVVWIAPAACRLTEKTTVGATLLDASGAPVGSPMVIAEASGFALATLGDRVALWLLMDQRLVHLTARCKLPGK
jgi:hypothetical protein